VAQHDELPPGPAPGGDAPTAARRGRDTAKDLLGRATGATREGVKRTLGGPARTRVIVLLASILALSSADASTVGASASELRQALHIGNAGIGLLVAVTAGVGAVASVPFGILVDRVNRIALLTVAIVVWGVAMLASASVSTFGALLLLRLFLGAMTAVAGPAVASLVGDFFPSAERARIYGYILAGELLGAGVGFFITGDVAALSWRAAFVLLAIPAFVLAWQLRLLPEPARGGASRLESGATRVVGRREAMERPRGQPTTDDTGGVQEPDITDAMAIVRQRGVDPDPDMILRINPRKMNIVQASRYVLKVKTNLILIASSACAYFFLTGVQTFGLEFVRGQYGIDTIVANLLMLVVGVGAVAGVLVGGRAADALVGRGQVSGRIMVAGLCALATVVFFILPLTTRATATAVPYLLVAAFFLTAQNPPLDAARLDIMPPLLWGRAEGIRTLLRAAAQTLAPLLFGGMSDLLGGGTDSLRITFLVMLLPLAASGVILLRGMRFYPRDVATAAASLEYEIEG
jgi:MFS family permease